MTVTVKYGLFEWYGSTQEGASIQGVSNSFWLMGYKEPNLISSRRDHKILQNKKNILFSILLAKKQIFIPTEPSKCTLDVEK